MDMIPHSINSQGYTSFFFQGPVKIFEQFNPILFPDFGAAIFDVPYRMDNDF